MWTKGQAPGTEGQEEHRRLCAERRAEAANCGPSEGLRALTVGWGTD